MASFTQGANHRVLPRNLVASYVATDSLTLLGRETRKHPHHQVRKLARSLAKFDFVLPIVIDTQNRVVAGWGLVLAARQLDWPEVPAVRLEGLTEADLRLLRLALNRLAEESDWNRAELKLEIKELLESDNTLDLEIAGFDTGEIDISLNADEPDSDEPPIPEPRRANFSARRGTSGGLGSTGCFAAMH